MYRPSKILVPTDFSDPSRKAIEYAIDLAQNYSAQVFVLHVITELTSQCAVDYCLDYQDFSGTRPENNEKQPQKDLNPWSTVSLTPLMCRYKCPCEKAERMTKYSKRRRKNR